jgi:hypothetical protein
MSITSARVAYHKQDSVNFSGALVDSVAQKPPVNQSI